jgi:GTP-binding protein
VLFALRFISYFYTPMAKDYISSAEFVMSNTSVDKCPPPDRPEYAFIGRSNVGKSSLINMLVNRKNLAKTSGTPGKTQLINHFIINEDWYLVDLPGYGFAKISKSQRQKWEGMIRSYLQERSNLMTIFVLVDSRHEPQNNDLEFIQWLGMQQLPIAIILTKSDKQSINKTKANLSKLTKELRKTWESLPPIFISSAENKEGREEILTYITHWNDQFNL